MLWQHSLLLHNVMQHTILPFSHMSRMGSRVRLRLRLHLRLRLRLRQRAAQNALATQCGVTQCDATH